MSKAKDRARAESGTIFRDGKLHTKKEWYAAHPTREMLAKRQAEVDEAMKAEMLNKAKTAKAREKMVRDAAGPPPFDYLCGKCKRHHKHGTKIHEQHSRYAIEQ